MGSDIPSSSFRSLELPQVIETSTTDFVTEFYDPLLSRATEYKRGVGYFTTNWLTSASRGITALADNGGSAKWVTSPILNEEDWELLQDASEARQDELLYESLAEQISQLRLELEYEPRNAIAWMIADELLDINFAVPTDELSGDFHDKFGIFYDYHGNRVAFHGSQNDSQNALSNYEAYTINCDWISEREAQGVSRHEDRFDELWRGHTPNIQTYNLPEAVADDIATLRDGDARPYDTEARNETDITLRDYQQTAVDNWIANGRQGLFEMATGTGKTFTALGAVRQVLQEQDPPSLVVVAVPVTHLADQWRESIEEFGFDTPRYLFGSKNLSWKQDLSSLASNINLGLEEESIVLTTHKTLSSEYFRTKVSNIDATTILIGDEVHRLGSDEYRKGLLDQYDYRLGLSATPERHYDEEGSNHLLEYFGGVVYKFELGDAIPEYLTPYEYHPIVVEMTQEELEEYKKLSKKLASVAGSDETNEEVFERLAMKRSRLVKGTENKYSALGRVLRGIGDPDHLLVYTNSQQIEHVQEILNEKGIIQHKFTYHEDDEERQTLLEGFDNGEYDALVAMRCLDEGVDVPSTRQAVLMSNSGNPMQFIQRRGRVLRQHPGKQQASIYDFIVVPTRNPPERVIDSERNILIKELRRFEEFAAHAKNEHGARNTIEKVRTAYGITDDDLFDNED